MDSAFRKRMQPPTTPRKYIFVNSETAAFQYSTAASGISLEKLDKSHAGQMRCVQTQYIVDVETHKNKSYWGYSEYNFSQSNVLNPKQQHLSLKVNK